MSKRRKINPAPQTSKGSPAKPAPDSTGSAGKFKPYLVMVLVVAAIGIPLILKAVDHVRSNRLAEVKASQPATLPKFLDIGTTTCAPCKAMLGVMADLRLDFPEKLDVQFINIQEDRDALNRYGIKIIPAQIFYSPEGKEIYRHTGFFATNDVVAKWKQLGYDLVGDGRGPGGQ
jgi:thioredoxin 1